MFTVNEVINRVTDREIKIEKLRRLIKMNEELLEAYEELKNNPEVSEEELKGAITEATNEIIKAEREIIAA